MVKAIKELDEPGGLTKPKVTNNGRLNQEQIEQYGPPASEQREGWQAVFTLSTGPVFRVPPAPGRDSKHAENTPQKER